MRSVGPYLLLGCSAMIGLGGCSLKDREEASVVQVVLQDVLDQHTLREARHFLWLAQTFLDKGQLDEAEWRLKKAISLNPRLGPAYNNLGLVHYERRELYEAARSFDQAIELMPGNPLPQNNLALTLECGGRLDKAIFHFERAHELEPENPVFLGNLLRARISRGDLTDDLVDMLKDLIFLDSRPEWVEWANDELHLMLPKARAELERDLNSLWLDDDDPAKAVEPGTPTKVGPLLEPPLPDPDLLPNDKPVEHESIDSENAETIREPVPFWENEELLPKGSLNTGHVESLDSGS